MSKIFALVILFIYIYEYSIVNAEAIQFHTEEDTELLENFKQMDNDLKVVEVKRKLMQALGGVNDVYEKAQIKSIQVKYQLLQLLRKLQTTPVEPNNAKTTFRTVAENIDKIIRSVESDPQLQRLSSISLKDMLVMPAKSLRLANLLISNWES